MSCGRPHATPCTEVVASLSAYIDGEVGAQEYRLIAVHITECPPCEREERAQRTVKALVIRATSVSTAPDSLHARIRAQVLSAGESTNGPETRQ
jgi:mycothiol system anti-sigma-R factor